MTTIKKYNIIELLKRVLLCGNCRKLGKIEEYMREEDNMNKEVEKRVEKNRYNSTKSLISQGLKDVTTSRVEKNRKLNLHKL